MTSVATAVKEALAKPAVTYKEWKAKFTKDAQDGKLNRSELRRLWRVDAKAMNMRKALSYQDWLKQIMFEKAAS